MIDCRNRERERERETDRERERERERARISRIVFLRQLAISGSR